MNEKENKAGEEMNIVRAMIRFAAFMFLGPALLFICAGTLNWQMAWIYTIMILVASIGGRLLVWRIHPDLLQERARYAEAEDVPGWDRALMLVVGMLGPLIVAIVAGLDHRFGWSRQLADGIQVTAALLVAIGYGLGTWAMIENRFFSAVARIQEDRGQVVVTSGPYRFVRHPAYSGALVAGLGVPVMLNACWALIPSVGLVAAVIFRTYKEDKMLVEGLEGYADYAEKTRWRLFPGVW